MRRDTRDVDNAAFAASHHSRPEFLARQQRTAHKVQSKVGVPIREGDLFERMVGRHRDFRIVATDCIYQNGRNANGLFERQVRRVQAFLLHGISRKVSRFATFALDFFDAGMAAFRIAADHSDFGARLAQSLGQSAAQSPGRTDDYRHFS